MLYQNTPGLFLWGCMLKNVPLHGALDSILRENTHLFSDGFDVDGLGQVKLRITRILEDGRGLADQIGCCATPSYIGACPWCRVQGIRRLGRTVYPGAIRYTRLHSSGQHRTEERKKYASIFKKVRDRH